MVSPMAPPPEGKDWAYAVLGLQKGATAADIRRAYLQRARETHPDKGGSSEAFLETAKALEVLTDKAADSVPTSDEDLVTKESPASFQKFTLEEVTELADQVRRLRAAERLREQEETLAQRMAALERRSNSMRLASLAKDREEAARLQRALRSQKRDALPAGIELCASRGAPQSPSVGPGRPVSADSDRSVGPAAFSAAITVDGETFRGPNRRLIATAEEDLKRLKVASCKGKPAVARAVSALLKELKFTWR